jgi:hypothetical protein
MLAIISKKIKILILYMKTYRYTPEFIFSKYKRQEIKLESY